MRGIRVSVSLSCWLAVLVAAGLLVGAWVSMFQDGWTLASAAAVITSSLLATGVYFTQELRRARGRTTR